MSNMTGFSVFQPTIGAPLQWLPAIGTPELDELLHALIPGPASIQDKRAHVSMDFFQSYSLTGESFKFYSVPATNVATSPASSVSLFDSGYASFNASPVVPEMASWAPSPVAFTPSVSADEVRNAPRPGKSTAASSRQHMADFSNHPGMRIMTKDGRDITNSASRGCKTKEQRDHAHLMRIIKACDACKRKKIRCDPGHKKRTASQASASPSHSDTKPAKKAKKAAASPAIAPSNASNFGFPSFGTPETVSSFQSSPEITDIFDEFVQFEQEPSALIDDFDFNSFHSNYDFFNTPQFTPSSSASPASQEQWTIPATPAQTVPSPPVALSDHNASQDSGFAHPYLNPSFAHGTNYADFNLYSPAADFFLDEEPQSPRKTTASGRSRQQSAQPSSLEASRETLQHASIEAVGLAHSNGYYSSPSRSHASPVIGDGQRYPGILSIGTADTGVGDWLDPGHGGDGDGSQRQRLTSQRQPLTRSPGRGADSLFSSSTPDRESVFSASTPQAWSEPRRHAAESGHAPEPSSTSRPSHSPESSALAMASRPQKPTSQSPTSSGSSAAPTVRATSSSDTQRAAGVLRPALVSSISSAAPEHAVRLIALDKRCAAGSRGVETLVSCTTTALRSNDSTLPMWRDSVGGAFSLLATLGLVSSLLVFALQSQALGMQAGHLVRPDVLLISCLSLASLLHGSSRLQGETCTKPTQPPSGGIIDNVKTKIQPIGQNLWSGLRRAFSRQLRTHVPRLATLTSVMV